MTARRWLGVTALGFAASAALHLATFTPLARHLREGYAAILLVAAFIPLAGMLVRLRRAGAPSRAWRGLQIYDWRALADLVPPPARFLVFAAAMYVLMNLVLSLLVIGGASVGQAGGKHYLEAPGVERTEITREEYDAHRAVALRLSSGHLLVLYLVPLVYFVFVDPRLPARSNLEPPAREC